MKICVLQSSYDSTNSPFEAFDPYANPAAFTTKHEIHTRFIHKENANQEIDAVVGEGFDLFLNLLWGQLDDNVAGIEAIRHLESLGVPFIGTTSEIIAKSKAEFYCAARKIGLQVPGNAKFPKFVKPSKLCGSMLITEKAICYNQTDVDEQVDLLKRQLLARQQANRTNANFVGSIKDDDIIVQEYIEGTDHSVIVLEMGDEIVALSPTIYQYPSHVKRDEPHFLTFNIKFDKELYESVMNRSENPILFDKLKAIAVEAYRVNGSQGGSWANVDIRVRSSDSEPIVLEVNCTPALFYDTNMHFEDIVIRENFPGGHTALLDVLIATKIMKSNSFGDPMAALYDNMASSYEDIVANQTVHIQNWNVLFEKFNFDGTILDLGSGTGLFGRCLHEIQARQNKPQSTLVGIDVSQKMADKSKDIYEEVHIGPLEKLFMGLISFDHIVALSALQFVRPIVLTAVMVRAFMLAKSSITLSIDDLPDSYINALKSDHSMECFNHTKEVEDFQVPHGWKLVHRDRRYDWTSPATGEDICTTAFRFEKE